MKRAWRVSIVSIMLSAGLAAGTVTHAQSTPTASCEPASVTAAGSASRLVTATNAFGLRLLAPLVSRQPQRNVFISPTSAALALEMTYEGARGATQEGMAHALGLRGMSREAVSQSAAALLSQVGTADPRVQLEIANSLWLRLGMAFQPAFLQNAQTDYGAQVSSLDFSSPSAPATVNAWVICATHQTIPRVVNSLSPLEILLLINTVYFHGLWTTPFDSTLTTQHSFTTATGQVTKVPLMHQLQTYPYAQGPDFQAVSLPYGNGRFAMLVVLPRRGLSLGAFIGRRPVSA